jgi:hypothetical protein
MDFTNEELEQKRKEVIAKFNRQFIDNNYCRDVYTDRVVKMLTIGANPYDIIEQLITANQELLKEFDKLIRNQPPAPIIIDNAEYVKLFGKESENLK